MTTSLQGRRILVTGASSGIGRVIARRAAAGGATVAGVARREDRLHADADAYGLIPIVADLGEPHGPDRAVEMALDRLGGGLDVLVNNAALYLIGGLIEGDVADWREMFQVNVIGLLATTKAALPALRATSGDIVNVGSLSAHRLARTSTAVYSATKSAVRAATEGMRQELAEEGIRVMMVSPGLVQTELGTGTRDPESLEGIRTLQDQLGLDPEDVAEAVIGVLTMPAQVTVRDLLVAPTRQVR